MGLAQGSYRMLRVLTDSSDQVSFHMSQFLGAGIVRAYKTERCGLAELRILLHPGIEGLLNRTTSRIITVTPPEEIRLNVRLEPISKSFKQYQQGCELHKAQEVVRIVLPARHNTALPLEPGKKALDLPPPRVAT